MAINNQRFIRGLASGITATVMMLFFQITSGFTAVLVEQGKPNAVIIISNDVPDSVQRAATELQSYVEKVSGAKLPIQQEPIPQGKPGVNIFLGESSFTKALGLNLDGLKSDGFKIVSRDNWLAILGRDYRGATPIVGLMNPWAPWEVYSDKLKTGAFGETGTLFGVFRFLEDYCGVRWYMPGDLGTVIPKLETIKVEKVNYQTSPDFEYRYPWFCNFYQADAKEDILWYRRAGFGAAYPVQIIHSFHFFLKYKDTHPEYFALIDGKRDFTNLSCIGGGGNLDLSNPDVAKKWVADINDYFDQNPQQSIYPLMPGDGMLKIDESPQSQAQIDLTAAPGGKFSNYVWNFVNNVAKEVYKTHPDKIIGCCAYEGYSVPPTNIKKLSPNVAVMMTKQRGSYNDKQSRANMNKSITAWGEKANHIYAWEYYLYSWRPWTGLPIVFPHIISDDLRFLKGVSNGEFIQAESWEDGAKNTGVIDYPGMQHINLYVTAKLLWDSRLNVDKLMNEYYTKFYGPAKEEMKGFWNYAEEIWMTACPQDEKMRVTNWNTPINIYTKDKLDKLSSFLEKARLKTPEDSVYRKRVELVAVEFLPARRKLSNVLVLHPPQLDVAGPTSAIKVDGVLDDSAWEEAVPMPFVDKDGEEAKYRTLAYTAWDNDYLYFAFINYEPEISKLTALATERDQSYTPAVWDDDGIEIFISPDPDNRAKCYQFIVNAKGTVWDGVHNSETPWPYADDKWNSGFDVKTTIEAKRWIVELRIPLKAIDITAPVAGKKIAANLFRNRHCGQGAIYSGWSPTIEPSHFAPARFGQITFKQ